MLTTVTTKPPRPNLPLVAAFLRVAMMSAGVALLLALVGYWPTASHAGSAGVAAMLVGIGVSLVGGWTGSLATIAYLRKPPREHPNGILLGLAVRFAVTLALALAVWLGGPFQRLPLLLWVGIAQLVILLVDVLGLVGLLKRAARTT